MPQKLETVLKHVEELSNDINRQLIKEYHAIEILFNIFYKFIVVKSMKQKVTSI